MRGSLALMQTNRGNHMTHSIIQKERPLNQSIHSISPFTNLIKPTINWKEIMKINIDLLSKTSNLSIIGDLSNLINSNITEDDIQSVSEGHAIKLIQVYQHIIHILLSTKQQIETNYSELEHRYNDLNSISFTNDQSVQHSKDLMKALKKKNKDNEKMLATYKAIISCLRREKDAFSLKSQAEPSKEEEEAVKAFFCTYCTGKKYHTEGELNHHLLKRHLISESRVNASSSVKSNEKEYSVQFDRKIESLKAHFDGYFTQLRSEGALMALDNERKVEERKQNMQLEHVERTFQEALNEVKDYYLNSTISKPQPLVIQHQLMRSENEEMMTTMLQGEFNKLNDNLESIHSQNKRIGEAEKGCLIAYKSIPIPEDKEKGSESIKAERKDIEGKEIAINDSQKVNESHIECEVNDKKEVVIADNKMDYQENTQGNSPHQLNRDKEEGSEVRNNKENRVSDVPEGEIQNFFEEKRGKTGNNMILDKDGNKQEDIELEKKTIDKETTLKESNSQLQSKIDKEINEAHSVPILKYNNTLPKGKEDGDKQSSNDILEDILIE